MLLRPPLAAADAGQAAGPGDEQEAQGAHAPDQVRIGAFAGAGFGRRQGVELEAPDEVVGEDAELLPGAVGAVVARGDDVEGELALELGDRLLLGAAAADEGVQGGQVQGRFVATAAYSKWPSSGVNRSSWKFLGLSWATCLR